MGAGFVVDDEKTANGGNGGVVVVKQVIKNIPRMNGVRPVWIGGGCWG